jgi:glycosyltransferase involved in cell wall biosynthesis
MPKGIITRPETLHICYLHHPPKSLYFYETPVEWQKYRLIKIYATLLNHHLRMYDYIASQRVDEYIANSEETKKRIEKFYRRDAKVIYPPVALPKKEEINIDQVSKGYYLTVSRLARPKHIEVMIEAAKKYHFPLKVVGEGRDLARLKTYADQNTEFLGNVTDIELKNLYKGAKAFLFASVDDEFGIAPVEALGHGLPVIAFKSGGLVETISDNKNGFLYDELNADSLYGQVQKFEKMNDVTQIQMRKNAFESAQQYSEKIFAKNIQAFVNKHMNHSSTRI